MSHCQRRIGHELARVGLAMAVLVAAGAATVASAAEDIGAPACRVRLLTPADTSEIPERYRTVVEPREKHRLVVAEALKRCRRCRCHRPGSRCGSPSS